jgi:hypothetical protein
MRAGLALLDALLGHADADPADVGAGPVEEVLHLDTVEEWDDELAHRCSRSAAWRQAVHSAIPPDRLHLPKTQRYLRLPSDATQEHSSPTPESGVDHVRAGCARRNVVPRVPGVRRRLAPVSPVVAVAPSP